jgi:hypothetical protein
MLSPGLYELVISISAFEILSSASLNLRFDNVASAISVTLAKNSTSSASNLNTTCDLK